MAAYDAVYLSGDSFPQDEHIEDAVRSRLSRNFAHWINQQEIHRICGIHHFDGAMDARQMALLRVKTTLDATRPWVLFGRSSGCRVATLFAADNDALAVICLGYPFRHPDGPDEPARFQHLATMTTPTLIIQGLHDAYGGSNFPLHYTLSTAVEVQYVDCAHDFRITAPMWNAVAYRIAAFLTKAAATGRR